MSDAEADLRRIQADAEHLGDAGQRAFKHRDQLVRKYVLEKKLARDQALSSSRL